MKKLLLAVLLFGLVSIQSYPQNILLNLNGSAKYLGQPLHPGLINIPGENLPLTSSKFINKKLYKSTDIKGTDFRPVKVVIDTNNRDTYSYDNKGNLITRLSEKLFNGEWTKSAKYSSTYDDKGLILTKLYEGFSNDIVKNSSNSTFTYDENGNLKSIVMSSSLNGMFLQSNRFTYTYDPNGNPATFLFERKANVYWENMGRDSFTCDSKGNILTDIYEAWENNAWKNSTKNTSTYDGNSNLITTLSETWKDNIWEKTYKASYTYNENGDMAGYLTEIWNVNAWENSTRGTAAFDAAGNMITDLSEQWLAGAWKNSSKRVYTYDVNGNAAKGESFTWSTDDKWEPAENLLQLSYNSRKDFLEISGSVVEVEYALATGVENTLITVNEYNLSQNYPNPFNPSTTINYSLKKEGNVRLTVFDALGKRVAVAVDEFKPAGSYSVKFDGSSLPSGMYIYRLEAGEFTAARKFLLMK